MLQFPKPGCAGHPHRSLGRWVCHVHHLSTCPLLWGEKSTHLPRAGDPPLGKGLPSMPCPHRAAHPARSATFCAGDAVGQRGLSAPLGTVAGAENMARCSVASSLFGVWSSALFLKQRLVLQAGTLFGLDMHATPMCKDTINHRCLQTNTITPWNHHG